MDKAKRVMLLKLAAVVSTNPLQNTPEQDAQNSIALGASAPMEHATHIQAMPAPSAVKPFQPATETASSTPPKLITKHNLPGTKKQSFSNPFSEEVSRRRQKSGLAKRTGDVQVAGLKTTTRSIV